MLPEYMLIVVGENLTLTWWAIVTAIIDETTATFGSQGSVRVCVSVCVLLVTLCFFSYFVGQYYRKCQNGCHGLSVSALSALFIVNVS